MTMTQNGMSTTTKAGTEQYEKFRLGRVGMVYQYDYRDLDGELFTTVAPKLKTCRERRDTWLAKKATKDIRYTHPRAMVRYNARTGDFITTPNWKKAHKVVDTMPGGIFLAEPIGDEEYLAPSSFGYEQLDQMDAYFCDANRQPVEVP